jgi:GNAT superfamily N-acetyltransferase
MLEQDINYFSDEFIKLGWDGRKDTLQLYFEQQNASNRDVLVAEYNGIPAGYITLIPNAEGGPFADMNIPVIMDFNVLPPYRRLGIGGRLMDAIEAVAKSKSNQISLSVGLYPDYGSAQRMYVKRGYIPDGTGLWQGNKNLAPYENCINSDDLNLFFIKQLD